MTNNYIEYIGYAAMALVVVSFMLKNISRIRMVNLFGCLCFVAYGLFYGQLPIIITNAIISVIQVYYLWIRKKV